MFERALLTPTNYQATAVNERILLEVEGKQAIYLSINTAVNPGTITTYLPEEFLNSVCASGLPAHTLTLKVGLPIEPLKNLSPPKLCNETHLKVVRLQRRFIEPEIQLRPFLFLTFLIFGISGAHRGNK